MPVDQQEKINGRKYLFETRKEDGKEMQILKKLMKKQNVSIFRKQKASYRGEKSPLSAKLGKKG